MIDKWVQLNVLKVHPDGEMPSEKPDPEVMQAIVKTINDIHLVVSIDFGPSPIGHLGTVRNIMGASTQHPDCIFIATLMIHGLPTEYVINRGAIVNISGKIIFLRSSLENLS